MSARWNSLDLVEKKPQTARTPASPKGKTQPGKSGAGKSKEREPAEKHVCLPPAPPDSGPWVVGSWTIRRATTYEPDARVVATGPAEDFSRFLAYLQAYQP